MNCLIQARYSSKRLKGKVLKKINKHEILYHVISCLKKAKLVNDIFVLTSKQDSEIKKFCKINKFRVYQGSLNNTFLRFKNFLLDHNMNYFMRISGDSPLLDHKIIDKMISIHKKNKNYDLITNIFPRTFPKGQSVEILKSSTYLNINNKVLSKEEKEHLTLYYYNNQKKFKILKLKNNKNMSKYNLSVDNLNDFELVRKIITSKRAKNLSNLIDFVKRYEKK